MIRASIPFLVVLAVALPAAAQPMPANPPAKVERAELPPPGAASPPRSEGAGSSSNPRENESLFREFNAWLKQQHQTLPGRKPEPKAAEGSGR